MNKKKDIKYKEKIKEIDHIEKNLDVQDLTFKHKFKSYLSAIAWYQIDDTSETSYSSYPSRKEIG